MRVRTPGCPSFAVDLAVAMLLLFLGCKTGLVRASDGVFRHSEHGYAIDDVAARDASWKAVEVDRAELAYSDGRGGSLTMLRECRGTAQPALLARQLRIGLGRIDEPILDSHPVALRGDPGWAQTFIVIEGAAQVLVRSVTLSVGPCAYDWILIGADDPERAATFERWWSSFERAPAVELSWIEGAGR